MKITKSVLGALRRGKEMEFAGGFCASDRRSWRRYETIREARLLKYWSGRRSRLWPTQFFTITETGSAVLSSYGKDKKP